MAYQLVDVQDALRCISSNSSQQQKNNALGYLEQFQKAVDSWQVCFEILSNENTQTDLDLKIFASQTVRNKVTYDLNQLEGSLNLLKETLFQLLIKHNNRLIVTQLSVSLARLSIQYLDWKSPIEEIISTLNNHPSKLLIFLKILPEETLDIKSTPLSQDEFQSRTHELIDQIVESVMKFLITCTELLSSSNNEITVELILKCLASWAYEFPIEQLLSIDPLISLLFTVLMDSRDENPDAFESSVECLCVILKETGDITNESLIKALNDHLLMLQRKLLPVDNIQNWEEYEDVMDALTRLFVDAGEAWCMFIGKNPDFFKPLVNSLLLLSCKNTDLDIVKYTLPFWFNLKQFLVLPRFHDQKLKYQDIYLSLINGMIKLLQYPEDSFSNKEEEDKFKEFRYDVGDVLKACTSIVGPVQALSQPFELITQTLNSDNLSLQWQKIEASLFSLRTMAHEIPTTENIILPQIFQLLPNLPEHPKIRYSATLVLGRYTEWTSKHPDFLEMELNYIFSMFHTSKDNEDLLIASSHALMYFCQDCASLLSEFVENLIEFVWKIEPVIDMHSMFEICQGLSAVFNSQPLEKLPIVFEMFLTLHSVRFSHAVENWKVNPNDKSLSVKVADYIDLLFAVFESLNPRFESPLVGNEPLQPFIFSIWNTLSNLLHQTGTSHNVIIIERVMKLLRRFFEKFHIFCEPILPKIADLLVQGYLNTGIGSYLWCSGSIIYIFGDDESYSIHPEIKDAVWQFACSQCTTFLTNFSSIPPNEIDNYFELIQDFYLMVLDILMFYPKEFITTTELMRSVVQCGLQSLDKLENFDAYMVIIRCLDELLSWGFETPPISSLTIDVVPSQWRQNIIHELAFKNGDKLIQSIISGLVTNFNSNAHPEAIGLMVKLFKLTTQANNNDPTVCMNWLGQSLERLGTITPNEKNKLMSIDTALSQKDYRKVRNSIKDFIGWYLRKHVSPRLHK